MVRARRSPFPTGPTPRTSPTPSPSSSRTGFGPGLSYYNSIQPFFDLSGPFKGLVIRQPSFYLVGQLDAVNQMRPTSEPQLREGLRGRRVSRTSGHRPLGQPGVLPDAFNDALLELLRGI